MVFRPMRKLQRMLAERSAWLKLREQRILQLEKEIDRTQARVRERDDWLLLREQRIVSLETEIDKSQGVVRDREYSIATLEGELRKLTTVDPEDELRIEIERRGALLRQREAHIRALEIEIQGRDAEFHLLRTALDQAEDVPAETGRKARIS